MLNAENAGLRERVAELERKVQAQEDELVCLRSSTADVLRRMNLIEQGHSPVASSRPPSSNVFKRLAVPTGNGMSNSSSPLPSRSMSQSTTNLRAHYPSALNLANRRTVSPSPRRASDATDETPTTPLSNGSSKEQPNSYGTTPRRAYAQQQKQPIKFFNVPIGKNDRGSPMRVWLSSQDMRDGAQNGNGQDLLSPSPKNGVGSFPRSIRRGFGSMNSLANAPSLRSLAHVGYKEPSFFPDQRLLQVFIRGRPINLPAPTAVRHLNPTEDSEAPKAKLSLEWVYGYRGKDCRSNLHFLPTGETLYFTAAVLVLFNPDDKSQRHYTQHNNDVKCVAVHPNKLLVASGQSSGHTSSDRKPQKETRSPIGTLGELDALLETDESQAHVRIWDSITLQTTAVLGLGDATFERSVSCVAFSKVDGGALLAAVDDSFEHTLSIWDWQRKRKITETKSANEQVFSCEFHPTERHLLVTCGRSHISFWTFDGVTLQKKMGVFEGRDKPKYVLSVCFSETGDVLSGDSNGTISVWDPKAGRVTRQVARVHQGGVFSLCAVKGGRLLSGGGGKDRSIIEWAATDLTKIAGPVLIPESAGSVRTIAPGRGGLILVGTTHNCILNGDMMTGFRYIVQGHMDELWGLCTHPLQQQFLTCGHDKSIKLWDGISQSILWSKEIADGAQCAGFHPSGGVLVVGTIVGRWLVIDALSREVVVGQKDGNAPISVTSFSPDGRTLAVGSQEASVYLYTVSDDARRYNRSAVCAGHSSAITAIDWSVDSQLIRTNSTDNELLIWSGQTGKLATDMDKLRDTEWASGTCGVTFESVGVWPENSNGADLLAVDRSHNRNLIAASFESGAVRLYSFPCTSVKAKWREVTGHSTHVTGVKFLQNDARLVTIGAKDCAVFQWTVSNN
uniref:HELP domain-containing protein n=1 Tax=Plectus sambesii TaxID=2011161 RepID=A0A914ULR9_9BILA